MEPRTIVVKGTGNVKTKPDLIVITMTLTTTRYDYAKTMELAAVELETLRKAIVSAGHEKQALKTTSFNVRTEYESYEDEKRVRKQRLVGYSCTHGLKLEFDLDMNVLGETLAAISTSGVGPRLGIEFSVKDKNAIQTALLEKAVSDATEKATVLANAAGVSLKAITHINYNWGELLISSKTKFETIDRMSLMSNMEIEPEDVEVDDTVTVVWEIEQK